MSENPYEIMMPPTPFEKAVDKAIDEQNERFLADPEAQRQAEEDGDRWRHVREAEEAAGPYAVVVPVATARAMLAALKGEENILDQFSPGMTARMLAEAITKAESRG